MCLRILDGIEFVGIAHIAIVRLPTHNPVPAVQRQVYGANGHRTLHIVVGLTVALQIIRIGVVGRVAVIAADTHPQSGQGEIVHTRRKAILIGGLELERRSCPVVNPLVAVEEHRIQASHHLQLIFHLAIAAPEADARIMPLRWQDGVLALRTVDGEIVQRLMVGIVQAYGHDNMTELQVGSLRKALVDPQLLEFHLTAFLLFIFPFSSLVGLVLNGRARTRMLEFNLRAQRPALSEIIAHVDHGMRDVELAMTGVVFVIGGRTVAVHVVAEKLTTVCHLAIAAHAQTVTLHMLHHAVTRIHLRYRSEE